MWQSILPIAAMGVGAGSGVTASVMNKEAQEKANAQNIALAREQMSFQERMSSTAYQRGMADMKKAGLNPMLAFSQGGASAPAGSQARVESTRPGDAFAVLGNSAKDAVGVVGAVQNIRDTEAAIDLKKSQQIAAIADARLKESSAYQVDANTENVKMDTEIKKAEAPRRAAQLAVEREHAKIDAENAKYDNWLERIGRTFGVAGTGLQTLNPFNWMRSPRPSGPRSAPGKETSKQITDRFKREWQQHKANNR